MQHTHMHLYLSHPFREFIASGEPDSGSVLCVPTALALQSTHAKAVLCAFVIENLVSCFYAQLSALSKRS